MKTRTFWTAWLAAVCAVAVALTGPARAADNFYAGYDFSSATGLQSGATLNDLATMAAFTIAAFDPANTNRLFDSTTITNIVSNGVYMACVADGGITAGKIGTAAVTGPKLAGSCVSNRNFGQGVISNGNIMADTITPSNLNIMTYATNAVTNLLQMCVSTNGGTNVTWGLVTVESIQDKTYWVEGTNTVLSTGNRIATNHVRLVGWSWICPTGTPVNLQYTNVQFGGYAFKTNPIICGMQLYGYRQTNSGVPVDIAAFTNFDAWTSADWYWLLPKNVTPTGFDAGFTSQMVLNRGFYIGFGFIAEGEAP